MSSPYRDDEDNIAHDKIERDLDAMLDSVPLYHVLRVLADISAKQSKALGECAKGREWANANRLWQMLSPRSRSNPDPSA